MLKWASIKHSLLNPQGVWKVSFNRPAVEYRVSRIDVVPNSIVNNRLIRNAGINNKINN